MDFEQLWDSRKFHRTVVDLINRIRANGKRVSSDTIAEECREYFEEILEYKSTISTSETREVKSEPIAMVEGQGESRKIEVPPEVMGLVEGGKPAPKQGHRTWKDAAQILRKANDLNQRTAVIPMLNADDIRKACQDAGWSNTQISDIRPGAHGMEQVISR